MDSTIVTTAASPSGMAATARDTATIKVDSAPLKVSPPASKLRPTSNAKIPAQMASTSRDKILDSWVNFFCRGVAFCPAVFRAWAMRPICVSIPVAITTARPRPYTTLAPINTKLLQAEGGSACPSSGKGAADFSTGWDSPVRADSSTRRPMLSSTRQSAGIRSPADSSTTSPGTKVRLGTVHSAPPRSTREVAGVISCKAAMAFSALLSCTTPKTAFTVTTVIMISTSAGNSRCTTHSTADTAAAASSTRIIGSDSCSINRRHRLSPFFRASRFSPCFASRAAACLRLSPPGALFSSRSTRSAVHLYACIAEPPI